MSLSAGWVYLIDSNSIEPSHVQHDRAGPFRNSGWCFVVQDAIHLCTQFLETDALANTDRIQLLRFYHQVNFQDPQREQLLYSLRGFSKSHSEKKGVTLYGMVAEELAMRRHKDLAVAVLKQGLQIYAGSPGVSRLVNALVEVEQ